MDCFVKDNYGVNSSKFGISCTPDNSPSKKRMDQRRKAMDEWILKRQEAWKFQEKLLRSLTNKPTKDGHVLVDLPSQRAKEMKAVHEELLIMVEARERKMEESRMFVPRRVFLFNVDTFKDSQKVEGFENPKAAVPDPGNSDPLQSHVKPTAAKCSCEMKWIIRIVPLILVARSVFASTGNQLVNSGISAGVELAQAIADKNFENTMGKLLTKVGPYLGMVGPIVSLLSGLTGIGTETAELRYMRRMLSTIENSFDRIDVRLDEIARQIDWSRTRTQLYPYERRILSLKIELQRFFNSKTNGEFSFYNESFVRAYENGIQHSARMLYNHIVSSNFVFSKNILEAAIEGTNNDRRAVQEFMLGLTRLILLGSQIEMAYYKLMLPDSLMSLKQEWVNKFQNMRRAMKRADAEIVSKFRDVSANDARNIIRNNKGSANWRVADIIHDHLTDKFYWRTWLVVVYDDVRGNDDHQISYCAGYHDFRFNGYNFMIVSKSKTTDGISFYLADIILASPDVCTYTQYGAFWGGGQMRSCNGAKTVLNSIDHNVDCVNFSALAVIKQTANPAVEADYYHYRSTDRYPFKLIMFG